ncbi:MAG: hypothetical protein AMS15_08385 [Planctomycetes bacterium DG_23]|nr:MAG: hypothetical protein AMS15_08385 [Planctomycetes bacterium DG_23]
MKLRSLQIRLGIFVVVGLLLLMLTIAALGEFSKYFEAYYPVRAYFSNVSGIEVGTPVRLAGVNIGQVEKIQLAPIAPPVEVTLRVKQGAFIRTDATLWIGFEGTLAQRYLEFDQGSPGVPFLPKDGTAVVTKTDVQITFSTFLERLDKTRAIKDKEISDLLLRATDLADRLNILAEHIDKLAGDEEFQNNIKLTMAEASNTTEKAAALMEKWTEVGDETRALVSEARSTIYHTNLTAENIQELTKLLCEQTSKMAESLQLFVDNLSKSAEGLDSALVSLNEITGMLKEGRGSAGQFLTDETLYLKAIEAVDEVGLAAKTLNQTIVYFQEHPSDLVWGKREKRPWWDPFGLFTKKKPEKPKEEKRPAPPPPAEEEETKKVADIAVEPTVDP